MVRSPALVWIVTPRPTLPQVRVRRVTVLEGTATPGASYGFADCGESSCPFYLANIEWEASADLDVDVVYMSQTKTKTVEDLRSSLLFPVLGEWNTSSNEVSFDAGRVIYWTRFDISGSEFDDENGSYWRLVTNNSAITGTVNTSTKTVEWDDMSYDITGLPSQVTASLDFNGSESLDGQPPVASGTVGAVTCVEPNRGSVTLDGTSTDVDSDLEYEAWRIDDALVHVGSGSTSISLTNGTHSYEIRAVDSRGSFDHASGSIMVSCD